MGLFARKFGLASDQMLALQMVDANGSVITANTTHNADLLWASKGGGGGNFGVATRFTVKTFDVPDQVGHS